MTARRQPKTNDYSRMHVQMSREARDQIDAAAQATGMSRSAYMARKAYERALQVLGEDVPAQAEGIQQALDIILDQLAIIEDLKQRGKPQK